MVRAVLSGFLIAFVAAAAAPLGAQGAPGNPPAKPPSLESLYHAALEAQKAGHLEEAAGSYRSFLAAALDELGNSRSWTGDYAGAASLFREALTLTAESPTLARDYARSALRAGDLKQAETLARALVARDSGNAGSGNLHSEDSGEQAQDGQAQDEQAQDHDLLGLTLHRMNRDQDARKELEAAVALDASFTNQYDLAVVCLDLDDENCATHIFDGLLAAEGDSPALHMQIGLAYGNSDFTSRAVAEFRKVIAESPRYPEAHYCVAAALLAAGEDQKTLQEAEAELTEELAITPDDFLTYAALGKIAVSYHQYTDAERYLKRAVALNAKNPDAFLYLGQMDYETGRLSEAETNLRRAIQLTTDVSRNHFQIQKAHFLLGRIYMQQHRETEAHAEMQIAHAFTDKALSKDKSKLAGMLPDGKTGTGSPDSSAEASVAAAPEIADPAAAKKLKSLEEQLTPAIADSYNNLGAIAASQQKYTEALLDFRRAIAWKPSLEGADYNLGRAAFMASDFSDAVPPLMHYVRLHPEDTGIRGALAMSQFMTHHYSACLEALQGAGGGVTSIPQMQYIYAESLVKTGRTAAGMDRLAKLERAQPGIPEVHRALGEALVIEGKTSEAKEEFAAAIRLNPRDGASYYDRGSMELAGDDAAAAVTDLETAVRLSPETAPWHEALAKAYQAASRPEDAQREMRAAKGIQLRTQSGLPQPDAIREP